jgi:hypothetical protein
MNKLTNNHAALASGVIGQTDRRIPKPVGRANAGRGLRTVGSIVRVGKTAIVAVEFIEIIGFCLALL